MYGDISPDPLSKRKREIYEGEAECPEKIASLSKV